MGRREVESDHRLDGAGPQAGAREGRGRRSAIREGKEHHAARLLQGCDVRRIQCPTKERRAAVRRSVLVLREMSSQALLAVQNIEVIYDHVILVLRGVSLDVQQGQIVALLGANGAGKTTTLKAISNLLRAERGDVTKGQILHKGERIDRLDPAALVKRGTCPGMDG